MTPPRPPAHRARTSLLLVIAVAALVAAAAFVRARAASREGLDLKPRPDALEYGVAAAALVQRGDYVLPIGDALYPPRYPPGFPLLASPVVAASGGDPWAVRDAAFLYGVLGVAVAALLGALAAGLLGALVAGVVVALSPLAIEHSVLAMSETTSALLTGTVLLGAAAAAWRSPLGSARGGALLAAGIAGALAVTVRYTNVAFLLPALLFFGTRHAMAPAAGRRLSALVRLGLPALVAVVALALYHASAFGSPFSDGYRFWVPAIYEHSSLVFSPRYLAKGIEGYWTEGHLAVYGRELLGAGALLGTVAAVLAGLGVVRSVVLARRCPVARLLALATATTLPALVVFHLVYFWQDPRFLVPLLPLLAALAGSGAQAACDVATRLVPGGARAPIAFVTGAALLVLAGWGPANRLLPDLLERPRVRPPPPLVSRLPLLDEELERDALLICNFPVTLAIPALGDRREILVTNRHHTVDPHLAAIAEHRLVGRDGRTPSVRALATGDRLEEETLDDVARWVREGRPAYVLSAAGEGIAGAGITALEQRGVIVEETAARPPVTVFRLRRK